MYLRPLALFTTLTFTLSAAALTDGNGYEYKVTTNASGATLTSKTTVIYLGKSCDAKSPQHGRGTWGWANGGTVVQFMDKRVAFPRQRPPFEDGRCRL
jgi:hypothetical protein